MARVARPTSRRRPTWTFLAVAAVACASSSGVHDVNGDGRVIVACLGDSNTDARWPPPHTPKWCEFAAEATGWTFANHAVSGTTVTMPAAPARWAGPQLDEALADAPDAVVLAFGTNDVRTGRSTAEIVAAYRDAVRRVDATGAMAFVALSPPLFPPEPQHAEQLAALNAALRGAFARDLLIDFASGMTRADYEPDGIHPNADGQHKRAAAALRVLRPG
jgi:lysophospholipase L1-like esterase